MCVRFCLETHLVCSARGRTHDVYAGGEVVAAVGVTAQVCAGECIYCRDRIIGVFYHRFQLLYGIDA